MNRFLPKLLFFGIKAWVFLFLSLAQAQDKSCLENTQFTYWDMITGRDVKRILEISQGFDVEYKGMTVDAAEFIRTRMMKAILGAQSFLSLGEGYSELVFKMLSQSKVSGTKNIHAVDAIYADDFAVEAGKMNLKSDQIVKANKEKYPPNYHGQLFHQLDIKGSDGKRMKFDTVFSSYSVNMVMSYATKKETEIIFEKIFEHTNSEGVIFISPYPKSSLLELLLNKYVQQGKIKEYYLPKSKSDESDQFRPLLIVMP